jgi:hypothetical protein
MKTSQNLNTILNQYVIKNVINILKTKKGVNFLKLTPFVITTNN